MIYTNESKHGGNFESAFTNLGSSSEFLVASGYFGAPLIDDLKPKMKAVAKKGKCKILIGMIFHAGVTKKQKEALEALDRDLRKLDEESGVYISSKEYHGKIYSIESGSVKNVYVGSSNFSFEGFKNRLEYIVDLTDENAKNETLAYLEYLFSKPTTHRLEDVELKLKSVRRVSIRPSVLLNDYKIDFSEYPDLNSVIGQFDLKIRADAQPNSSLNLYFDKGRSVKKTMQGGSEKKIYTPRPWYEVELTSTKLDRQNPFYPPSTLRAGSGKSREGLFWGYFNDDGEWFKIRMVVHSDYGKNISSHKDSGGRATLGRYLKGKLESAGVLKEGDRITSDTLDTYGRDYVSFKKIDDEHYIIEF